MHKTKAGVVAAITSMAAVPAVAPAQTFADLLAPIPNASARLEQADLSGPAPQLIKTQYVAHHHHHHAVVVQHHHHHHYYRHYRRVIRPRTNHHHHHHNY